MTPLKHTMILQYILLPSHGTGCPLWSESNRSPFHSNDTRTSAKLPLVESQLLLSAALPLRRSQQQSIMAAVYLSVHLTSYNGLPSLAVRCSCGASCSRTVQASTTAKTHTACKTSSGHITQQSTYCIRNNEVTTAARTDLPKAVGRARNLLGLLLPRNVVQELHQVGVVGRFVLNQTELVRKHTPLVHDRLRHDGVLGA